MSSNKLNEVIRYPWQDPDEIVIKAGSEDVVVHDVKPRQLLAAIAAYLDQFSVRPFSTPHQETDDLKAPKGGEALRKDPNGEVVRRVRDGAELKTTLTGVTEGVVARASGIGPNGQPIGAQMIAGVRVENLSINASATLNGKVVDNEAGVKINGSGWLSMWGRRVTRFFTKTVVGVDGRVSQQTRVESEPVTQSFIAHAGSFGQGIDIKQAGGNTKHLYPGMDVDRRDYSGGPLIFNDAMRTWMPDQSVIERTNYGKIGVVRTLFGLLIGK